MLSSFLAYLPYVLWFIVPVAIWSAFWQVLGLWFSARKGEKGWFVVFIFIHSVGILEIYYLHSRKCWPFKNK